MTTLILDLFPILLLTSIPFLGRRGTALVVPITSQGVSSGIRPDRMTIQSRRYWFTEW